MGKFIKKTKSKNITKAEPVKSAFGLSNPIINHKSLDKQKENIYQTIPQVKKPAHQIRIKVDLTQLVSNNFVDTVSVNGEKGSYVATIYISSIGMQISGYGKNILSAITDLNEKVIDMNFEL